MAWHLLQYRTVAGINDANVDMTAVADPVFSQRSGHFILSEQYNLIAAAHLAASALRSRFNVPSWNAFARGQIWPVNRSATPPSYPRLADYRNPPMPLPLNEELAIEESNNLGAATEETTVTLWVATPDWPQVPQRVQWSQGSNQWQGIVRATAAVARTTASWSGLGPITFAENLRGGRYEITGAWCFDVNIRAFRLFFPRAPVVSGRIMRPGALATNAVGNLEHPWQNDQMGSWGTFHSFEPPQLEVYADAAGASTQELRLELSYLGPQSY